MQKKNSLTDVMMSLRATPAPAPAETLQNTSPATPEPPSHTAQPQATRPTPLTFVQRPQESAPAPAAPVVPAVQPTGEEKRQVSFRVPKSLSEQWTVAMSATGESGTALFEDFMRNWLRDNAVRVRDGLLRTGLA